MNYHEFVKIFSIYINEHVQTLNSRVYGAFICLRFDRRIGPLPLFPISAFS